MGLLSSAFAKGFVKGVGENIVDWQDEVKEKEDLYNENLIKAKRRVNEITTDLGKKYDDSVSLVNRYGGGAFGNYLVQNYSFDQLSEYNNLSPSVQEEQIRNIKAEFDKIKDKSAFTNADFTKTAKEKLDEQVQATKTSTISQIAGEEPVAPTGKVGQVLTGGIRAGAEAEREKIMGGFAEPVTTAEYAPVDTEILAYSPTLTPIKVINNNTVYDKMLVEDVNELGEGLGTYSVGTSQTNPYYQTVANIDAQAQTMIEYGFTGTEADARAYIIEKMNNPEYNHPNLRYLTNASDNAPIINTVYTVFSNALSTGETETMRQGIDELKKAGRNQEAQELQEQFNDYISRQKQQFEEKKKEQELIEEKLAESKTYTPSEEEGMFPSTSKPRFRKDGPLTYQQWSDMSPNAVKEIYKVGKGISTEGLSEADKAIAEKINTALGLS